MARGRRLRSALVVSLLACLAGLAGAQRAPAVELVDGEGGHVLAIWQPLGDVNHPVRGALLEPGSPTFGKPFRIAPGPALIDSAAVGPNGDLVVAWSALRPLPFDDYEARSFLSIRRAGAGFAAPIALTGFQDVDPEPEVAVNSRGDVLAVWKDARLRTQAAVRPAGGELGTPVMLSRGTGAYRVALDDSGGAVALSTVLVDELTSSRREIRARYRSPDGAWTEPVPVANPADVEVSLTGFDSTADGRVLAVWTVGDSEGGDRVQVAERAPGERFSAPADLAEREGPNYGVIGGPVALAPGGAAATIWERPGEARIAVRDAGGLFPPGGERLAATLKEEETLFEELVDVAIGPGGDVAAAWRERTTLRAVHRPAGGSFARPVKLGRFSANALPRSPQVAVGADGRGVSAWETFDLERTHQLARAFGPGGVPAPQRIASSPPWVREGPPSACFPRAGRTVARNGRAHVFRMRVRGEGDLLFACLLAAGVYEELSFNAFPAVDLAGPLVAFAEEVCRGTDGCSTEVRVADLRSGAGISKSELAGPGEHPQVGSVRLKPDGAVAWIACPGSGTESFGRDRNCRRPGPMARVYMSAAGRDGARLLAAGRGIDPKSLRLSGSRLTWRDRGRTRSATLR